MPELKEMPEIIRSQRLITYDNKKVWATESVCMDVKFNGVENYFTIDNAQSEATKKINGILDELDKLIEKIYFAGKFYGANMLNCKVKIAKIKELLPVTIKDDGR